MKPQPPVIRIVFKPKSSALKSEPEAQQEKNMSKMIVYSTTAGERQMKGDNTSSQLHHSELVTMFFSDCRTNGIILLLDIFFGGLASL